MVVRSSWRDGPLHFLLLHFTYCHYMHSETASSSSASYGVEIFTFWDVCWIQTNGGRKRESYTKKEKRRERKRRGEGE